MVWFSGFNACVDKIVKLYVPSSALVALVTRMPMVRSRFISRTLITEKDKARKGAPKIIDMLSGMFSLDNDNKS